MGALDPKNRHNLGLRVASAVVLFPLAVWITILGGLPFALLAPAAGAVAGAELILMFSTLGAAEVLGIAGSAAIPLVAAFGRSGGMVRIVRTCKSSRLFACSSSKVELMRLHRNSTTRLDGSATTRHTSGRSTPCRRRKGDISGRANNT